MSIFNKITYFVGVLVFLGLSGLLLSEGDTTSYIIFGISVVIILAYYFIFVHSIKEGKKKHKFASWSIIIPAVIIAAVLGVMLLVSYIQNVKAERQYQKEATTDAELNKIITDLSFSLTHSKDGLAEWLKTYDGKPYLVQRYIIGGYEGGYVDEVDLKRGNAAFPIILKANNEIADLIKDTYGEYDDDFTITYGYLDSKERIYGYYWALSAMLELISNQKNIKKGMDYDKILSATDMASDEYVMKWQYAKINWFLDFWKSFKAQEEEDGNAKLVNGLPLADWSGNEDVTF